MEREEGERVENEEGERVRKVREWRVRRVTYQGCLLVCQVLCSSLLF